MILLLFIMNTRVQILYMLISGIIPDWNLEMMLLRTIPLVGTMCSQNFL